ncbi:DJ-1/PfpI family protein [Bradyrhizobium sp. USDA 4461]
MQIMPSSSKTPRPRRAWPASKLVAVLAYDGVNAFELGIATEVFGLTDMAKGWYRLLVCAERPGRPLATTGGIKLVAEAGFQSLRNAGTIIVTGWQNIDATPSPSLLRELRRAHASGSRIVSICSGVFILAAAGLLDGRRVAVHWAHADMLARKYPVLRVVQMYCMSMILIF